MRNQLVSCLISKKQIRKVCLECSPLGEPDQSCGWAGIKSLPDHRSIPPDRMGSYPQVSPKFVYVFQWLIGI